MHLPHRFALWKPTLAVVLGACVGLAMTGSTIEQRTVAAVFVTTVVLWATEAFPVGATSLMAMVLLALVAGVPEAQAFGGLGDPIVPLFLGSLILAKAMEVTGVSRRVALVLLQRRGATATPWRLLLAFCVLTGLVSTFLSNTATVAMILPVALSVIKAIDGQGQRPTFAIGLLLAVTMAANVTVATPVGTAPDLIAVGDIEQATHHTIGFLGWMTFGVPITLLMIAAVAVTTHLMFPRKGLETKRAREATAVEAAALGPLTRGERVTLGVLGVAIALWVLPSVLPYVWPGVPAWLPERLTASVVGVAAVLLLFVFAAPEREGGHVITWKEAASIDWGIILLLAAGISLGNALFSSGLARDLGNALVALSGAHTLWAITALGIALAIILSEFCSNTATATALLPVMIGVSEGANVSPVAPVLGAALGASMGFLLPFSTATNAMVYATGLVPQRAMAKSAIVLDVVAFFVILGTLYVVLPLVGLA